jgi:hypothetical protein
MILGAAAGALTGEVMDDQAKRNSRHDGELDDEIGVTCGDLGRPAPAAPKSQ